MGVWKYYPVWVWFECGVGVVGSGWLLELYVLERFKVISGSL